MPRSVAVQAQLRLAQCDVETARRWAETSRLTPDDEISYPREAEYLALARLLISQGRNAPASHKLRDAARLLDRLLVAAETGARIHSVIEILSE